MKPRQDADDRGLARLTLTRDERESPLWQRLEEILTEERDLLREQNDHPSDIKDTTLLRGELRIVKRILARTSEVGPESRQSEGFAPESASPSALLPTFK